jgi:uncharacterized protein YggE
MRNLPTLAVILSVLGLVVLTPAVRGAPSAATGTPPTVGVTGEGVVHAAPDTARVRLGVEVFGPRLAPADTEADQRISSVVLALRNAGVPEAHIRTVGLVIKPQYDTRENQPQVLSGYLVQDMLEVEIQDLPSLGGLLDGAMAAGANRVESIRFECQDLDRLQAQARDQAWQSARAKAEQLAQKAGTRLDRVTLVDEPSVEVTTAVYAEGPAPRAGVVAAPPSPVQTGEVEVRAQVRVTWSTQ